MEKRIKGKMPITEKISQFIVDSSIEKMPREAVKIAKQAIMDCVGCALLGAVQPIGKIIAEFVMEIAAKPVAWHNRTRKKNCPGSGCFSQRNHGSC